MDNNSIKPSLKKLRSRLKAKLLGQRADQSTTGSVSMQQDGNITDTASSSMPDSDLDNEARAVELRLSGTMISCVGTYLEGTELLRNNGSSSYLSDDERSGSDLTLKRKKRCISADSRKQAHQLSSSSSSSSYHTTQHSMETNNTSLAGPILIKHQRKKLKKNQRGNEKKVKSTSCTGFSTDSPKTSCD
jgi:hypothetical protein